MSGFPWDLLDRVPTWFWWLLAAYWLVVVACGVGRIWINWQMAKNAERRRVAREAVEASLSDVVDAWIESSRKPPPSHPRA